MPKLYPRGTKLSDVPLSFRGLSVREYEAHLAGLLKADSLKARVKADKLADAPIAPLGPEIAAVPGLQRTIWKKVG
jgi:hypothetical protein